MKKKFVEIEEKIAKPNIFIRVENIANTRDVERVGRLVNNGRIVFARLKYLLKNLPEYETVLSKLKRFSKQFRWNLVLIGENYALITPKYVEIVKE